MEAWGRANEREAEGKPLKRDEAPRLKSEISDRHTVTFGIETGTCSSDLQNLLGKKSI